MDLEKQRLLAVANMLGDVPSGGIVRRAANELERLRAENTRFRAALFGAHVPQCFGPNDAIASIMATDTSDRHPRAVAAKAVAQTKSE